MNSFDNWKEEYGLQYEPNYSEHTEKDCKSAFNAGAQSRQGEVVRLQTEVDELRHQRDILSNKVNELQKRIDEVVECSSAWYGMSGNALALEVIKILKGEVK